MDLTANRQLIVAALARIPAGDKAALQTVYRLTSAKLFAVCLRILNDRGEAEDVLQDVYVTVWSKAADFDPARASPMTWLITIARNRAIDRLRVSGKTRPFDPLDAASEVVDTAPMADQMLGDAEDSARLHHCLGALSPEEGAAVRGAFFNGSTYEEISQRDGLPLGTVKSRIRRALIKLKTCLETGKLT